MEHQELAVHLVSQGLLVRMEHQEQVGLVELQEQAEHQELVELQVSQVLPVRMEHQELAVLQGQVAHLVSQGLLARMEHQEQAELQVHQEQAEQMERAGLLGQVD